MRLDSSRCIFFLTACREAKDGLYGEIARAIANVCALAIPRYLYTFLHRMAFNILWCRLGLLARVPVEEEPHTHNHNGETNSDSHV